MASWHIHPHSTCVCLYLVCYMWNVCALILQLEFGLESMWSRWLISLDLVTDLQPPPIGAMV